jgi:HK97 family phage major capsid protein
MGNERFDGAEKDMHDLCYQEARMIGLPTRGGILYKRQSVTTTPAAAGFMIPTTLNPLSPGAAKVGLDTIGVKKYTGLTGVNNIPVLDLIAESAWVGESADHTNVDPTLRNAVLTAKALRTKIGSSWLMRAMGQDMDNILNQTLEAAKNNTINKTIVTGAGTSTIPIGIMNAAGVIDVTGTNGAAITFALLLKMINSPSDNDSSFVNPAWAASPAVREILSNMKVDAGSGDLVWPYAQPNNLMAFTAAVSTHVPKNLTKGSGNNLMGLVYGYWDQFISAEWAVKEMIEDKVTDETGPKLIEITFGDNAVLNPKAFAKGYFSAV